MSLIRKTFTEKETGSFDYLLYNKETGSMKLAYRSGQEYLIEKVNGETCEKAFNVFAKTSERKGIFFNTKIKLSGKFEITRLNPIKV